MGEIGTGPFCPWGMQGKQGRRQGRKSYRMSSVRDTIRNQGQPCFCAIYTAIIGLCAKFDSLYHNATQRSRKMKRLLDNLHISVVHFFL